MKLNASQLLEGENKFAYSSEKNEWVQDLVKDIGSTGTVLLSPLEISFALTRLEPDYYVKGRLGFTVEQNCARCAEPFALKVDQGFELALVHSKNTRTKKTVALAEDSEELDITYFEGPEIEVTPLIREQFFLSLPYQAVCDGSCQGVCQVCGINKNVDDCRCAERATQPSPFEVLKTLRNTI